MATPALAASRARRIPTATRAWIGLSAVIGAAVSIWAAQGIRDIGWMSSPSPWDSAAAWLIVVAAPVFLVCALVVWAWRPGNRCGPLMVATAVVVALWAGCAASSGVLHQYNEWGVPMRVLLFWLVLAWPGGWLTTGTRRFLIGYAVALVVCWPGSLLFTPELDDGYRNHILLVHAEHVGNALFYFGGLIVVPAGAVIVLLTRTWRHRRLSRTARWLDRPALYAAIAATFGEFVLVGMDELLRDLTRDDRGLTAVGFLIPVADVGRFVVVPILLLWAAARARRFGARADRVRSFDLGTRADRRDLQERLALAVGDESARVAFAGTNREWVTLHGEPVELGGPDRTVTVVTRDGEPVASLELDGSFRDQPALVEAAVAAVGATIEHERLAALAGERMREAQRARVAIVEVEDAARRRLERDLHDGAQQRLVGLALQASMAARDPQPAAIDAIEAGVREVRRELDDLASGLVPAILAERGLGAALTTFAATTPIAVDVDVSFPPDLDARVAAVAWFVVGEAVANAVKHAGADALRITGSVENGALIVSVSDDGSGGADEQDGTGLRALRRRVSDAGGALTVTSERGRGTTVVARLPREVRR